MNLSNDWHQVTSRVPPGGQEALVGEAGGLHVVAGPVGQAARPPREERQALGLLQHHLQLLEVLQPGHVFVLRKTETHNGGRGMTGREIR